MMTNYPAEYAKPWVEYPRHVAMQIFWIALCHMTWRPWLWAQHHDTCWDLPSAWFIAQNIYDCLQDPSQWMEVGE
jgi:hypothetical protein